MVGEESGALQNAVRRGFEHRSAVTFLHSEQRTGRPHALIAMDRPGWNAYENDRNAGVGVSPHDWLEPALAVQRVRRARSTQSQYLIGNLRAFVRRYVRSDGQALRARVEPRPR